MAVRRTTYHDHRPDFMLQSAHDRIAALRASARTGTAEASPRSRRGFLAGTRDALGRRLIAAGTALVTDDSLRRRPALRP